ncbi:MAG TPA: glutamine synthetase type III [Candidatus Hydrogenedentes bacterium]|nr:glutamine synthetase type III [Candidatus Hydrogenedentota bacterium]
MSGSEARLNAVKAVIDFESRASDVDFLENTTAEIFGENVFNLGTMQARLPKAVFKKLKKTIETGSTIDSVVADVVASAMKDWAVEKGATHYTHVFYPLTGFTAEKHDSFVSPDGNGGAILEFGGNVLIQGEPDASSFPSGGIRTTFEARGYTAWDVTSPAYILENPNGTTLCIPTAFISWTGEALDKKTPILRSQQALDIQAQRILRLFGYEDGATVNSTAGAEQEYFMIDQNFYHARPDLAMTGRTLFGAASPKGQEFDDHYFGAIPERVLACMHEAEHELFKLGVPIKPRHNEVAPGQYEIAPVFEGGNVATDHQQLIMIMLKKVALRHGMTCLLHEKPFAGLNDSGKHLNWSMGSSSQGNILDPGDTPHDNAKFLVFCGAVIRAVDTHAKLLRAVISSAGNDHRLGANEAPPAIISIFLGDQLTDVFNQIKKGGAKKSKKAGILKVGVDSLPSLPKDAGDRNRTSPFAFTGNRFEFRAVASNQSIAGPIVALNTIVADSLDYIATQLEKATKGNPKKLNGAIQKVLKEIITKHGRVIFNGDNYAEAWHKEAEDKRKLPNLRTSIEALPNLTSKETLAIFKKHKVLSPRELAARQEVYTEQYCMTVAVEANTCLEMGRTIIFPAAVRYQSELAVSAANLKAVGIKVDTVTLDAVTGHIKALQDSLNDLEKLIANVHGKNLLAEAKYYCTKVLPKMLQVREAADALEGYVADDLWPLPTYQEMLFIK